MVIITLSIKSTYGTKNKLVKMRLTIKFQKNEKRITMNKKKNYNLYPKNPIGI